MRGLCTDIGRDRARHASTGMSTVLVVASSAGGQAERVRAALEAAGHDIIRCSGPHAPTFLCPGAHGQHCGLTGEADLVLLDGWLGSDVERRGVPSWHLLRHYRTLGLPVLVLIGPDGLPARVNDPGVLTLPRNARAAEISDAVRSIRDDHLR